MLKGTLTIFQKN